MAWPCSQRSISECGTQVRSRTSPDLASCLPARTCSISSGTNSPAGVDGGFPWLRSHCTRLMVSISGSRHFSSHQKIRAYETPMSTTSLLSSLNLHRRKIARAGGRRSYAILRHIEQEEIPMKSVVLRGVGKIALETVPAPKIRVIRPEQFLSQKRADTVGDRSSSLVFTTRERMEPRANGTR